MPLTILNANHMLFRMFMAKIKCVKVRAVLEKISVLKSEFTINLRLRSLVHVRLELKVKKKTKQATWSAKTYVHIIIID